MRTAISGFVLSGFADEIDPDLESQIDVLDAEGIEYLELRSVDGTNVLDLSWEELERIKETLDNRNIGVSAIGSPIGKVDVTDDFGPHLERFRHALSVADLFDTEYVRIFSYWIPKGDDPVAHRETVLQRMRVKAELARESGVVLLHENEKDIYGDVPERCRDILTAVDSPNLRAVFDPANFLEIGVRPYPDALLSLIEYVEYVHVKDAEFGKRGAIKPAGHGDAEMGSLCKALRRRGFSGFASLEPHLRFGDGYGGFSGPDAFKVASEAFKRVVDDTPNDCR